MGLLSDVYSYGDTLKRKISDLAKNPGAALEQFVGQLGDDTNTNISNMQTGYGFGGNQSVLTTPKQKAAARSALADYGAQSGISAATVWHGSPHKFDKFDSSKIGTGEGAQAYGHGLYLAESPDVAKRYKPNIPRPHVDGVDAATLGQPLWEVSDTMASRGFGVDEYKQFQKTYRESQIESALKAGNARKAELLKESLDEELKIADGLRGKNISRDTGSLYKVDLPDEHIAKMLDWDKPLSQQSNEVQKALTALKDENGYDALQSLKTGYGANFQGATGQDILRALERNTSVTNGRPEAASSFLKKQGIPGIRYLDGGSRGAGSGSSNFVVFPGNEGLLSIMERNGSPLK